MARLKSQNPFYVLLMIVGVVFFITSFLYGIIMVKDTKDSSLSTVPNSTARHDARSLANDPPSFTAGEYEAARNSGILGLIRRRGELILAVELGILAICTAAAMGTDSYWQRKAGETTK